VYCARFKGKFSFAMGAGVQNLFFVATALKLRDVAYVESHNDLMVLDGTYSSLR
jgi:hypothetical protein